MSEEVVLPHRGRAAPVDQMYWLSARVRSGKISFFGFFRTEVDALEAVSAQAT